MDEALSKKEVTSQRIFDIISPTTGAPAVELPVTSEVIDSTPLAPTKEVDERLTTEVTTEVASEVTAEVTTEALIPESGNKNTFTSTGQLDF